MVQSYRKTMCVTKNERALDWLAAQVGIDEDIDMLDTGHAHTMAFSKLQIFANSVITFVSDSADTPARFR